MWAIPIIGTSGFAIVASAAGSAAGFVTVAASFGAAGAGLSGSKMARRIGSIEEFEFKFIGENHSQGPLLQALKCNNWFDAIAVSAEDGDMINGRIMWMSTSQVQDGRIDYGEFVAMMQKGSNMGLGRRTMRKSLNMQNSLSISMRYAPGAH